ncbi:MAG: hypothetical protein ACLFU6_14560 [Candidatus Hydrogenedentota bacterium]
MAMFETKRCLGFSWGIIAGLLLSISSAWAAEPSREDDREGYALNHVLEEPESQDFRNVFLGLALLQGGERLDGSPAVIGTDNPLLVEIHWETNTANSTDPAIEARFLSHRNRYVRSLEAEVTPNASAEGPVPPGSSFWRQRRLDLGPLLGQYSGLGYLVFYRALPGPDITRREPLDYAPVYIEPVPRERTVSTSEYARFFPENRVSLDTSVRLGHGAEVVLPLEKPREAHGGLGVVSSFGYGSEPQGEAVAEVEFLRDGETLHVETLRAGVHTARADYDFNPDAENHQKIPIIESDEADYLSAQGTPFMRHKYVTILDLEFGAGAADSIRIRSRSPVILEIHDLVLTD